MTGHDGDVPPDGPSDVGSSTEEALKLISALTDWARDQTAAAGQTGAGLGAGLGALLDSHLDTGAPECTWCPVCRTVHLVRSTSPEVRAHLATAASSLLQAAAGLLAAASAPPPARGRSVERIDLDDTDHRHDTDPFDQDDLHDLHDVHDVPDLPEDQL